MTGLTDFITKANWETVFTYWFVLVDDAYQALERHYGRWRRRGPQPRFHDSEVITVGLLIDTWFGGDEAKGLAFVRQYHRDAFPHLPPNGQFNARRQQLRLVIEQLRRCLLTSFGLLDPDDPNRWVDSMPVPVCSYGRASRCRSVSGPDYVGWVAAKKSRFFGFRLQATVNQAQVVEDWLLTPAARKDGKMLTALLDGRHARRVFGDNAYQDPLAQADLLRHTIQLYAVPRRDSQWPWPPAFRAWVQRYRLRVETAFSVLQTAFQLQHPGSRSLAGLVTRTASRLLAYTLCFLTAPLFAMNRL